ncbi:hypothetical protein B0H16DRAFT_1453957 [Mycena metata]|uniref:Uncharacterized protein n=1 Tax=Mycena metata TaxID=1033252 RepID=A0AAD7JJA8_9AGAR|nr:hypothetical protein B0H16DRAFT_1453957 [Mycena metata]
MSWLNPYGASGSRTQPTLRTSLQPQHDLKATATVSDGFYGRLRSTLSPNLKSGHGGRNLLVIIDYYFSGPRYSETVINTGHHLQTASIRSAHEFAARMKKKTAQRGSCCQRESNPPILPQWAKYPNSPRVEGDRHGLRRLIRTLAREQPFHFPWSESWNQLRGLRKKITLSQKCRAESRSPAACVLDRAGKATWLADNGMCSAHMNSNMHPKWKKKKKTQREETYAVGGNRTHQSFRTIFSLRMSRRRPPRSTTA